MLHFCSWDILQYSCVFMEHCCLKIFSPFSWKFLEIQQLISFELNLTSTVQECGRDLVYTFPENILLVLTLKFVIFHTIIMTIDQQHYCIIYSHCNCHHQESVYLPRTFGSSSSLECHICYHHKNYHHHDH